MPKNMRDHGQRSRDLHTPNKLTKGKNTLKFSSIASRQVHTHCHRGKFKENFRLANDLAMQSATLEGKKIKPRFATRNNNNTENNNTPHSSYS